MARIDDMLVDSFSGNWLKPQHLQELTTDVTKEYISKVKSGKTYKECGINYTPTRQSTFDHTHWENQHSEIFQVRTFYWLVEQICNYCNDLPLTMVELGAGGGYYSLLFNELTRFFEKECLNVCSEIFPHKVDELIERLPANTTNVHLCYTGNLDEGTTEEFGIEYTELLKKIKHYSLSDIISKNNLTRIDLLHLDIQGGELDVIKEIEEKKLINQIRYLLISTHDDIVPGAHEYIEEFFINEGIAVLVNVAQPADGWAMGDGFILAHNPYFGDKQLIPERYCKFTKEFDDLPAQMGDSNFVVALDNGKLAAPHSIGVNPSDVPKYNRIYLE